MRGEKQENICYKFAGFRLETDTRTLSRQNGPVHLAKRPFEILLHLIENRARVVSRYELLEKFWQGHDVYDDALRKTVSTIRHALDDTTSPWRYIETLRGSGFSVYWRSRRGSSRFKVQSSKSGIGRRIEYSGRFCITRDIFLAFTDRFCFDFRIDLDSVDEFCG